MGKTGLALLCGLLSTLVFQVRYAFIDDNLYEVRDDGVITMSVGRHLIEYGFVGVSPSGPIVEASSSPVQMLVYASVYALSGVSVHVFAVLQTLCATFVIGALAPLFFAASARTTLALTAIFSVPLTFIYPFFLWHGSGMENALTHALLLASLAGMVSMMRFGKVRYFWAVPLLLTSVVRFELALTVLALLGVFSLVWWLSFRNLAAVGLSLVVIAGIVSVHWLRYSYFGVLFPNTAVAQNISPLDRLSTILGGDFWPLREGWQVAAHNILNGAWWIGLVCLPISLWLAKDRADRFLIAAVATVLALALALPSLLGYPRIDWGRTYSHVAIAAILLPLFCLFHAMRSTHASRRIAGAIAASCIGVVILQGKPYYLGWEISNFDRFRKEFAELASDNDIRRPLVANPDLGIMTWHKEFNVLDLGMLGSPIVADLRDDAGLPDYILEFAQPDFIEAHGYWIARYCDTLFGDARFAELYSPINEDFMISDLCEGKDPGEHFWIRKDIQHESASAERNFIDVAQAQPTPETFRYELAACSKREDECTYVTRTAFRLIPELVGQGHFDEVLGLFERELDRDYLTGWRDPEAPRRIAMHFRKSIAGLPD